MKLSKGLGIFFFMVLCLNLHAQNRMKEMINVAYAWNPDGYFSALDAKVGAEFLRFGTSEWSAVLNVREADLEMNNVDTHIHLKNYRLTTPLVSRLGRWFTVFSPGISVRNASHSFVANDESIYFSGIALANYRNPESKWSYSMGVVYSKEMEDHFFLPIVGLNYTSPPLKLNLGFPNFSVLYQPTENWEFGLKANFDSATYTLGSGEPVRKGGNPGLRVRVIDVGPVYNVRLSDHIWLNTNLGIVALAEAHTVSARGSTRDLVYKSDNALFMRVSLSYYPVLK